jgi:hypothetical protein
MKRLFPTIPNKIRTSHPWPYFFIFAINNIFLSYIPIPIRSDP